MNKSTDGMYLLRDGAYLLKPEQREFLEKLRDKAIEVKNELYYELANTSQWGEGEFEEYHTTIEEIKDRFMDIFYRANSVLIEDDRRKEDSLI